MDIPFAPCLISGGEGLVERGDIWEFTAILYLVRMAEVSNSHKHLNYMKFAYQALPGLRRDKRFRKRWREALDCLKNIHYRNPASMQFLRPIDPDTWRSLSWMLHIKSWDFSSETPAYLMPRVPNGREG